MNEEKPVAGYSVLSETWYAQAVLEGADYSDEITIGLFYKDDGCDYEFSIKWIKLGSETAPRLEIFDEAWKCFRDPMFQQLFNILPDLDNPTVADVKALLDSLGFIDMTEREQR